MLESSASAPSALLASLIRASGLEPRQIEDRLGSKVGDLRSALEGGSDLTLRQTLAVLAHLGIEPNIYFEALFPRPADLREGAHLAEHLRERIREADLEPREPAAAPLAPAELEMRVREAIREASRASNGSR